VPRPVRPCHAYHVLAQNIVDVLLQAIAMFNLALELPGNGAYRMPGSPREYSCPSDAEETAALYNMACCYSALGQTQRYAAGSSLCGLRSTCMQ
jgi:hypothetical protein